MNLSSLLNPEPSGDSALDARAITPQTLETQSSSAPATQSDQQQWDTQQAADVLASLSAGSGPQPSIYESSVLPYTSQEHKADGDTSHVLEKAAPNRDAVEAKDMPTPAALQDSVPAEPAPDTTPLDDDDKTAIAIALAQNEYGTRRARRPSLKGPSDSAMSPTAFSPPPPTAKGPVKKRAAPKNSTKGGVKTSTPKKPPSKKPKIEHEDRSAASKLHERSATPASATSSRFPRPNGSTSTKKGTQKASKSSTPLPAASPTASASRRGSRGSSVVSRTQFSERASSVEDENEVYCICRRPDNHTWMIGCDGGCEDWFHGRCVNMRESDDGLIDKYICPNCVEIGAGVTTWKPMCRREGCRKPARLKKGSESKYCSDDCGVRFMKERLEGCGALNFAHSSKNRDSISKRRKQSTTKSEDNTTGAAKFEAEEPPDLGPLGGQLRAHELKTLVQAFPVSTSFRRLGSTVSTSGVFTPPATTSPDTSREDTSKRDESDAVPQLVAHEQTRLDQISARKTQLRARRKLLQDRGTFVAWVKEKAQRAKERKIDGCQYDSRLAWDEATFRDWRESTEGCAAFDRGGLDGGDMSMTGEGDEGGSAPGVCGRKKCGRHSGWQKIAVQDVRFEEGDVGDEMREVDREEGEILKSALGRRRLGHEGGRTTATEADGGVVEVVEDEEDHNMIDVE